MLAGHAQRRDEHGDTPQHEDRSADGEEPTHQDESEIGEMNKLSWLSCLNRGLYGMSDYFVFRAMNW